MVLRAKCLFEGEEMCIERLAPTFFKRINIPFRSDFSIWDRCYFYLYEIDIIEQWIEKVVVDEEEFELYEKVLNEDSGI